MMHPLLWRLAGFGLFMMVAWASLTILLLVPFPDRSLPAWQAAAVLLVRLVSAMATLASAWLAFSWLIDPEEQD